MLLDRAARVYVEWELTGAPEDLLDLQVYLAGQWRDAERLDDPDRVRVLVAGPAVEDDGLGEDAVTLPLGLHTPRIRAADNPEVVVAGGGVIIVS